MVNIRARLGTWDKISSLHILLPQQILQQHLSLSAPKVFLLVENLVAVELELGLYRLAEHPLVVVCSRLDNTPIGAVAPEAANYTAVALVAVAAALD